MTDAGRNILLFGDTGKLGGAVRSACDPADAVTGYNTGNFDAADLERARRIVEDHRPDIVVNTVALLGIDACERDPDRAFRINALFPRVLAESCRRTGAVLVHFSTDAVFDDAKDGAFAETDGPSPINVYGLTKYGGDCFVRAVADRHYLFRVALLFGPCDRERQFVERMLGRVRRGEKVLRIADDIVFSPTFSVDAARAAMRVVTGGAPFGLYHLTNSGEASLYELMSAVTAGLGLDVRLEKGSHRDFPGLGRKNLRTPLRSLRLEPLRPWREAVAEYCRMLEADWRNP